MDGSHPPAFAGWAFFRFYYLSPACRRLLSSPASPRLVVQSVRRARVREQRLNLSIKFAFVGMTNAAVLAHSPRHDESTASTILSPRQETKQTELNCATNTGVGGAILSGFALDQIDWMAKPDDPGSYGAAIAFFVSAELSLLSAIASASIYRRLNSLSSSAVEEFVEQHAWLLNGPWWLFLAGGTSFLVGMASSAFMNDTDLGLRCIGAVTAGITTCGLMCFAHASSDSGMLGTIRRPPRRGDAPLSPIQRVVSSPSHG